jgi:hypothetical protein
MAFIRFEEDPERDLQTMVEQCARAVVAFYARDVERAEAHEEILTALAFGMRLIGHYPAQTVEQFISMLEDRTLDQIIPGAPPLRLIFAGSPTQECHDIARAADEP